MTFVYFKGATAYELQIGRLYVKVVHLMGGGWKWHSTNRISFGWETDDDR